MSGRTRPRPINPRKPPTPKKAMKMSSRASNLRDAGFEIAARKPRLKPCRTEAGEADRKAERNILRKLKEAYYTTKLDATIHNKKWKVPKPVRERKYVNSLKARFHLRKRSDGLNKGYTKPACGYEPFGMLENTRAN